LNLKSFRQWNKNAQWGLGPTLVDWLSFIVLILFMIIMVVVFSLHSASVRNQINEVSVRQDTTYYFLNLLRTPITVDDADTDISSLIAVWYLNDAYEDKLKAQISKQINDFYGGNKDWELKVGDKKVGTLNLVQGVRRSISSEKLDEYEIDLPLIDNPDKISMPVRLIIYSGAIEKGTWCRIPLTKACSIDDQVCTCSVVGTRLLWTDCQACAKGCDVENKYCKGENVAVEGERCYNLARESCTADEKLCGCDGLSWKNCVECSNGCDQTQNACK